MCTVKEHVVEEEGYRETRYLADLCDAAVCVEDFCGYTTPGHLPISFWADWCLHTSMIYFGGMWSDQPPTECPDEETAYVLADEVSTRLLKARGSRRILDKKS